MRFCGQTLWERREDYISAKVQHRMAEDLADVALLVTQHHRKNGSAFARTDRLYWKHCAPFGMLHWVSAIRASTSS